MQIDFSKLTEVIIPKIKLLKFDERFYLVPDLTNYAISTYGRLYYYENNKWHKVKQEYSKGFECYRINIDETTRLIKLQLLISKTFFGGKYVTPHKYNSHLKWDIKKLHTPEGKAEEVERIQSLIEHRNPTYDLQKQSNEFIGRTEYNESISRKLHRIYWDIVARSCYPNTKAKFPQYKNTTISEDWLNNKQNFFVWYIQNDYYYPGKKQIDKDIMSFASKNEYSSENAILIPEYINKIFTSSYSKFGYSIIEQIKNDKIRFKVAGYAFSNRYFKQNDYYSYSYIDALQQARKMKANYIRAIIENETKNGYIPKRILDTMNKWANLCELGKIEMWEPDFEKLQAEGIF